LVGRNFRKKIEKFLNKVRAFFSPKPFKDATDLVGESTKTELRILVTLKLESLWW
jgi:hypothetical protein